MSSNTFQRWEAVSARVSEAVDPQLERLRAQAREQAWAAGHAEGYAAGLEQGLAEGRRRAAEELAQNRAAFADLLDSLAAPLAELEQQLLDALLQLGCALARRVLRHELSVAPARIAELVREGVAALPATARQVSVHLNPLDLDLVRGSGPRGRGDARVELVADAGISRGGCRISSEASEVDLTLETRLDEAFARLRESDAP
ncbi:FliH/SctL family protein [Immundisolibacter sp.]|uniref:FliH/SctL family protein n=1 Tax=Immundisolibacter sp. TaxID=1934948 RepID=UPI00262CC04D|nr:FliH/SctL family protein [Immundisolibacter sp.]MDD3650276.1 FliH/SctL family protein [Immundisolibacter sp.]